jgi:hypothetical protein
MTNPSTPIETTGQLKEYLYVAIQLEHATIPPYLTTAYTAKIEANKASIDIIATVAKEEMLHLTLAANLLNAIGGTPDLLGDGFVPQYPCHLPNGETDFEVSIAKFSDCAIDTFLNIERPSPPEGPGSQTARVRSHGDIKYVEKSELRKETRGQGRGIIPHVTAQGSQGETIELHYWTIGEFYNGIRNGFKHLTDKLGEKNLFAGDKSRQIDPEYYFSAGGDLTRIVDLDTALAAIELISDQGEGYTNETQSMSGELAHYYRFEQIAKGTYYQEGDLPHQPSGNAFPRDYSAVYPIKKDAKIADYSAYPDIERQARLFNGRYKRFLEKLNSAFNGQPDLFAGSYKDMYRIKREMEYLIRNPLSDTGENAAPTFEMTEFIYPPEDN